MNATLAAVFGGGGPFGIAYGAGVAHALIDAGLPVANAPMLGTSAGSWVASCLALDVDYDTLAAIPQVRVPHPRPNLLRDIARDVLGRNHHPLVTGCAVRLPSMRRSLLSGSEFELADIVAASSAVPGLFAPVLIGGKLHVDGGVRSLASAHLAAHADHLLVVAPVAGPMFGPAGRSMEAMLLTEIGRWQRATGGTANLIRPDHAIASLAKHPLSLFDHALAAEIYPMARQQTEQLLLDRPRLAQLVNSTWL